MKFPKLVIEEAKALRKHATKDEKAILNFESLNPHNDWKCIYGQMTGHCHSERAVKLIKKCCRRVYKRTVIPQYTTAKQLNGSPVEMNRFDFWSPIEVFIAKENHQANAKLISYLKGEIKSL